MIINDNKNRRRGNGSSPRRRVRGDVGTSRPHPGPGRSSHSQSGTAVLLMLVLMAILMILVASNVRTLWQLKQELRLVERRQIRRLEAEAARTNAVPRAATEAVQSIAAPERK